MKPTGWKSNLLRHIAFYAVDMAAATIGFVYGFGLTVQNWWALIGMMIFARFLFHKSHQAYFWHLANEEAKKQAK